MEFKITGRHVEVTEPIREYARKRTEKLHKYYDRIQAIAVVLDKRDHAFDVEVMVDVERHADFVARKSGDDLYACIDGVVDALERQLTDHKEKLRNRKHNV
jgi:putative sigma-54 modulation protein